MAFCGPPCKAAIDVYKRQADDIGFDRVELPDHPSGMAPEHLQALREIVGEDLSLIHI